MKTLFTQAFPPDLKDYYDSKIAVLTFDPSNTATGTDTVTINANSGIAVFTDDVGFDNAYTPFSILNSLITTDTKIVYSLGFEPIGDEVCQVSAYTAFDGELRFFVNNFSGSTAIGDKTISFRILNP